MTCRGIGAGPIEDYKADRTHQAEAANSNAYRSLPLGQRSASTQGKGLISA